MSRISFVLFLTCLFAGDLVKCHLIGREDLTRDIPVQYTDEEFDEVDDVDKDVELPLPEQINNVETNRIPGDEKQCVPIGQFCMNHSDCCTNACLGYMKRCVSG